MDFIDALLRCWARWCNDGGEIRRLTGCGPGPIDEAGPPAVRIYGESPAGEVWEDAPAPLMDDAEIERVDDAIKQLSAHLASIVQAEYRVKGMTQGEKAKGLRISHEAYRIGLYRAKNNLKIILNCIDN